MWPQSSPSAPSPPDFQLCEGNWQSAESDVDTTLTLVEEDIRDGFVEEVHGGMDEAKSRWGDLIAVGRLGIATAEGRKPRLGMDSTIAGVNGACQISDKVFNPTVRDVRE